MQCLMARSTARIKKTLELVVMRGPHTPKLVMFKLKVPKLRQQTFETAIIERYRWRESSVEEALIEDVSG